MRKLVVLPVLIMLAGCTMPRMPRYAVWDASYEAALVQVEKPKEAQNRYGEVLSIALTEDNKYTFQDSLVTAVLYVTTDAVNFQFENRTKHSIKIIWDEASFIDTDGTARRVMHKGVKYVDRNASQPPTVIPAKGRVADFAVPTDRVWYKEGTYTGGWRIHGLIQPDRSYQRYEGEIVPAPSADFTAAVRGNEGRRFGLLLPLEIQGIVNEYTFWFEVTRATVGSAKAMNQFEFYQSYAE